MNELRASFTRLRLFDAPLSAFQQNEAAALGLTIRPRTRLAFGLPYFFLTDFSTVTDSPNLPQIQRDNTWDISDSFSILRGHHTWTVGFEAIRFLLNYQQSNRHSRRVHIHGWLYFRCKQFRRRFAGGLSAWISDENTAKC